MSYVQFNTDAQQYRVVIPRYKRLPPNPHIGDGLVAVDRALAVVPASETDANSELTPESRQDKELRNQLLVTDQRSFFTGSAAADLQAAHLINPVRRNAKRKQQVEGFLTQQKLYNPIQSPSFVLDSTENVILLEANLHVQWDLYGTFCFVPTEEDANTMLHELRSSNQDWQERHLANAVFCKTAPRLLDISQPPFARPHWEVVVLHPRALLPDGQPLAIAENQPLYSREQTSLTTLTWNFWVTSGDNLSSLQEPDKYLNPFLATDLRDRFEQPQACSLAMVINTHCKLEQFLEEHGSSASDRVKRFAQLMSELVTEIFFVPGDGYIGVAVPPQPETVSESQSPPTMEETMDLNVGDDFLQVGGVEAPEIPDADGLTNSEFQLVALKAQDPHLDAKERADAAIMMLFGTRRHANPYGPYDHASQSVPH